MTTDAKPKPCGCSDGCERIELRKYCNRKEWFFAFGLEDGFALSKIDFCPLCGHKLPEVKND